MSDDSFLENLQNINSEFRIHMDIIVILYIMSISDGDCKPFPVDYEANEDDEKNAKNSQRCSDSSANDSWDQRLRQRDNGKFMWEKDSFMENKKLRHKTRLYDCTWVLWEYNNREEHCYWDQRLLKVHKTILQSHIGEQHEGIAAGQEI